MIKKPKIDKGERSEHPVYLNIDHLKDGSYVFNIMLNNKIVKSFKLKK
jgi:hypothetical protein